MSATELKVVSNATCTFCGCVCDDIELTVEGQPHHRGQAGLRARQGVVPQPPHRGPARRLIEGQPAAWTTASSGGPHPGRGASIRSSTACSDTTCEAQRVAVGIADWIGGTVDTTTASATGRRAWRFRAWAR